MIEHLAGPVYQRLALTLLHFLWQGAFIGLLLAVCLRMFRSSQLRYAACCGALLALVVVPVVTFAMVNRPTDATTPEVAVIADEPKDVRPAGGPIPPLGPVELRETPAPEPAAETESPQAGIVASIGPYCVLGWMAGTLFFGGRLLLALFAVGRMKRNRGELPATLKTVVERIAKRLRLRRIPGVFTSERVRDAMAVGFFRPVVLLPLSWLTQLPPEVLRSVIAHELAHIRRWDQWVNLLQRVVETILFYHPAVWWISHRTRVEREFRCDELALAVSGGAVQYAEALERVARFRMFEREPLLANSMGGTRMALLKRVKNVLGMPDSPRGRTWWAVGLLAVCLPAAIFASSLWRPSANADETAIKVGDGDEREAKERDERRKVERKERRERDVRRERDRPREGDRGERRDRPRGERERDERNERKVRRDRPREGDRRREGDRARREGDRPRREGDRRRDGDRREGDRPDRARREGDRERPRRDGDRRPPRREGDRGFRPPRRDGDFRKRPPREGMRELLEAIRDLRNEVKRLRQEVDELKGRKPRPPREGDPQGPMGAKPRPPRDRGEDGFGRRIPSGRTEGLFRPRKPRRGDAKERRREGDRERKAERREGEARR